MKKVNLSLKLSEGEAAVLKNLCESYDLSSEEVLVECLKVAAHIKHNYAPQTDESLVVNLIRGIDNCQSLDRSINELLDHSERVLIDVESLLMETQLSL